MEIKVLPHRKLLINENETLMEALIRHQLPVQNICNGKGTCGKCKVRLTEQIPPPSERDRKHLQDTEIEAGIRLACAAIPQDGMTIELHFVESQDRKESALLGMKTMALDPGIKKLTIDVAKPSLSDERGDWDRIADALGALVEHHALNVNAYILRKVPEVLRSAQSLTATVSPTEILEIEAGDTTEISYGIAVDIGTTSVAAALVDLNKGHVLKVVSTENEQTAYGADVISRISFAKEDDEQALKLQTAVRRTINRLVEALSSQMNVSKQTIYKMTVVANTTMHHLFLGLDVSHLAVSPFVSVCNRPLAFSADELGIEIHPKARVSFFPNIGSFVGGDTMGAILGAPEVLEAGNHLLIDLGTNCELFLKTNNRLMACSTAAGPAFEGAGITFGMRAKQGAIEGVTLTEDGVVCQVIDDQEPIGICGSGLIEAIDEMKRAGVINRQGMLVDPEKSQTLPSELRERIRIGKNGREFVLAFGSNQGWDVTLCQKDIGELQLAKGAVCAGIKTLVDMAGITVEELDTVILSGTFATYLKAQNILNIGLVPDISPEKIKTVGNAAHVGAVRALLDNGEMMKAEALYRQIGHVELGGSVTFSNYFMNSMYLERLRNE